MSEHMHGQVAIVTGGSRGLGMAISLAFAQAGASVVMIARDAGQLAFAAADLQSRTGTKIVPMSADVRSQSQVDGVVGSSMERFGRLDILVNCAANPAAAVTNLAGFCDAPLLDDLDTKVVGYLRCARAVEPLMTRQGRGRIVNVGGFTGRSSGTLAGLRNAAVSHLTKSLSDELGPRGITVNAVHPGLIRTPHLQELFENQARERQCTPADAEAEWVAGIPIRRLLDPSEVANLVLFLASPSAAGITGESIAIDGGLTRGIYL